MPGKTEPVNRPAWGDGVASFSRPDDAPLECFFAAVSLGEPGEGSGTHSSEAGPEDPIRNVRQQVVRVVVDLEAPPEGVADAYLRLHLLSYRLVRPNEIDLTGIFGVLPNVCWSSLGPIAPSELPAARSRARSAGVFLGVNSLDKFPRMTDYVVPSGVRIADASRVRLGAHLAEGTTVMHEGFVNFNAGTLGACMVEGRISQGVVVGDGTDLGGGSSIMGTLSGGNATVVSIGRRCLLGANSGVAIPLGDDCIVEAGLYLTAGTVVTLPDGSTQKARDLAGRSGLLYRRNSQRGNVEALVRSGEWAAGLNAELHANQ
ncbi:MAG: dapD [Acidimicrobiaceae bacterium]|nr:dapD [Acidimicrobiaceae bacterium]